MRYSKEESKMIWDQNAEFWDYTMGDESNDFHRNVVRPKVTELLNPNSSDYILDIACGNGNYSAYLAEKGIDIDMKQVEAAVQSAYEKSPLTPTADPKKIDPVLEAIKTAPNRANKLTLDKNDVTGEVKG